VDPIREQILRRAEAGSLKGGHLLESQRLRHSFISYRVAQTRDIAAVALEAGNSPE
jgi:hypothetical protein